MQADETMTVLARPVAFLAQRRRRFCNNTETDGILTAVMYMSLKFIKKEPASRPAS
jgi:hypothetical protein